MASRVAEPGWSGARPMAGPLSAGLPHVLLAASPPLLFGLRLWASVCLALYVAFWLQLDNPFWAGTSAAIVCQPQLGASLRKGWFRMIGTVVGATMIVVLTACFPQDRCRLSGAPSAVGQSLRLRRDGAPQLRLLWGGARGLYRGDLAARTLGATGGPSADVFMLAVIRASEICIGIVCAGLVLAGNRSWRRPAPARDLVRRPRGRDRRSIYRDAGTAGPQPPDTQSRAARTRNAMSSRSIRSLTR